MKKIIELLRYTIANEIKYVESMHHSLKEDELTILRLQNKARCLEKEIEERKQLIEEYRGHLRSVSEPTYTTMKQMSSTSRQMDADTSTTLIKLVKSL